MKRRLSRLIPLFIVFVWLTGVVHADTIEDHLIPRDSKTYEGQVPLKYNQYDNSRYQMDLYLDESQNPFNLSGKISDSVYAWYHDHVMNGIWMFHLVLFQFVMKVVYEAFQLDFISSIIVEISAAIQSVAGFDQGGFRANGVWPSLVILIITVVGSWAAYVGMVKRETSRAFSGLLSMILIFALSLGFFARSDKILTLFNGWSRDLQTNILNASTNIISPGSNYTQNEGIAAIHNQMFDVMVYRPYLFLQYGTGDESKIGAERIHGLLQLEYGSEERNKESEKEVKNYGNTMMSKEGMKSRGWFIGLLFFANLVLSFMMLLMAAAIILYQVVFIALVLFAPVPLLIALVPSWQQTAFNWAMKCLHALLMKVGFALLMTIIFAISTILYKSISMDSHGYLFVLGMQILCYMGIWLKRKELFSFVATTTAGVISTTRGSLDSYREYRSRMREVMQSVPGAAGALRSGKSGVKEAIRGKMRKGYSGSSRKYDGYVERDIIHPALKEKWSRASSEYRQARDEVSATKEDKEQRPQTSRTFPTANHGVVDRETIRKPGIQTGSERNLHHQDSHSLVDRPQGERVTREKTIQQQNNRLEQTRQSNEQNQVVHRHVQSQESHVQQVNEKVNRTMTDHQTVTRNENKTQQSTQEVNQNRTHNQTEQRNLHEVVERTIMRNETKQNHDHQTVETQPSSPPLNPRRIFPWRKKKGLIVMLNLDVNRRSDRIKLFLLIFVCFSIVSSTIVFLSGGLDEPLEEVVRTASYPVEGEPLLSSSTPKATPSMPLKGEKPVFSEFEQKKSQEVAQLFAEAYYTYDAKQPDQYLEQSKIYISERMLEREKLMIRRQTLDRNLTRVKSSRVLPVDHDDPYEIIWSVVIEGEAVSASREVNPEIQEFFVTLRQINAEWKVTDYTIESGGDGFDG